jgi:hypothetical protein
MERWGGARAVDGAPLTNAQRQKRARLRKARAGFTTACGSYHHDQCRQPEDCACWCHLPHMAADQREAALATMRQWREQWGQLQEDEELPF